MLETTTLKKNQKAQDFPFQLTCPLCQQGELNLHCEDTFSSLNCTHCGKSFDFENGFPNLVIGQRFEDESDDECLCYEEDSNAYTTQHYWIPLFNKIQKDFSHPLRILAIGCGIGTEVDMICDAGFKCVGIDNGNRSKVWPKRKYANHFLLANGIHLPFNKETFDVVFCGCVFPHVGVIGDSIDVTSSYKEDRLNLATEMCRVLVKGGSMVAGSPNKKFPFDIFHGREAGSYKPHYNKPGENFLLSTNEYNEMFMQAGCSNATAQPVEGYWGFVRSKYNIKGLILSLPVRFIFWLISRNLFSFLRGTALAPWIIMSAKKSHSSYT